MTAYLLVGEPRSRRGSRLLGVALPKAVRVLCLGNAIIAPQFSKLPARDLVAARFRLHNLARPTSHALSFTLCSCLLHTHFDNLTSRI